MTGATFVFHPELSQQFFSAFFASAKMIAFIARHHHPLLGNLEGHKFRSHLLSDWIFLFAGNRPARVKVKQVDCCCCSKLLSLTFGRLHVLKALFRECFRNVKTLWS